MRSALRTNTARREVTLFQAGTHTDMMSLMHADFERPARPVIWHSP